MYSPGTVSCHLYPVNLADSQKGYGAGGYIPYVVRTSREAALATISAISSQPSAREHFGLKGRSNVGMAKLGEELASLGIADLSVKIGVISVITGKVLGSQNFAISAIMGVMAMSSFVAQCHQRIYLSCTARRHVTRQQCHRCQ